MEAKKFALLYIPNGTILMTSYGKSFVNAYYTHLMVDSFKYEPSWRHWDKINSKALGFDVSLLTKEELTIIKL